VAAALSAVRTETFDVAVLDINLRGERVYPVAEALMDRQIPFLFVSGYGDTAIPPERRDWIVCAKPFLAQDLAAGLSAVLAAGAPLRDAAI
jgi:hypothetical protein